MYELVVWAVASAVLAIIAVAIIGHMASVSEQHREGDPRWHLHTWEKCEVYYTTTRGLSHAIIRDRCRTAGCRMVKTTVGGPLLLWPQVTIKEEAVRPAEGDGEGTA